MPISGSCAQPPKWWQTCWPCFALQALAIYDNDREDPTLAGCRISGQIGDRGLKALDSIHVTPITIPWPAVGKPKPRHPRFGRTRSAQLSPARPLSRPPPRPRNIGSDACQREGKLARKKIRAAAPPGPRVCLLGECGKELPADADYRKKYCSDRHSWRAAWIRKQRVAEAAAARELAEAMT